MTATLLQATDDIGSVIYNAWTATGAATENVQLVWPNRKRELDRGPQSGLDKGKPYGRVRWDHSDGGQKSLASPSGTRRFERIGLLIVEIWVAKGTGTDDKYSLAQVMVDALETARRTTNGVVFQNVRLRDVPEDEVEGPLTRVDVLCDFRYDEVK